MVFCELFVGVTFVLHIKPDMIVEKLSNLNCFLIMKKQGFSTISVLHFSFPTHIVLHSKQFGG